MHGITGGGRGKGNYDWEGCYPMWMKENCHAELDTSRGRRHCKNCRDEYWKRGRMCMHAVLPTRLRVGDAVCDRCIVRLYEEGEVDAGTEGELAAFVAGRAENSQEKLKKWISSQTLQGVPTVTKDVDVFSSEYILPKLKSPIFQTYIALQLLAAYLELGIIFFVCAILFFIVRNTGTEEESVGQPKKKSAYSVFNEGMERLDGSLTAEQFEKEIYRR
ncbi:SAYSvFN domain-containing protein 1 [Rhizophlyctis rosea]|nr:SAYSvFN domain-containing protein 1 [Rhizophlyctis rosea]